MNDAALQAIRGNKETWNDYRKQNVGQRIDLSTANLKRAQLVGYDLSDVDLTEARLPLANLTDANLSKALLVKADLTDTVLRGANLSYTDFSNCRQDGIEISGANCEGMLFPGLSLAEKDLSRTNFKKARLQKSRFERCQLQGTLLDEAELAGSIFAKSNLTEASFQKATITGCEFIDTVISNANFDGADLSKSKFHIPLEVPSEAGKLAANVSFVSARLEKVEFSRAAFLKSCKFDASILQDVKFAECFLEDCRFGSTSLIGANFTKVRGKNNYFAGSKCDSAQFSMVTLPNSDFSGATMRGADLTNAILQHSNFEHAILQNASFLYSDLMGSSLRWADLTGSKLLGANVKKVRITRLDQEDIHVHNYLGLRKSQLYEMQIEDAFGEEKRYFGGFWSLLHVVSTTLWLTPIFFLVLRSVLLSWAPVEIIGNHFVSISLIEQILGYCKSGQIAPVRVDAGYHYPWNAVFLASFILILLYNAARVALVIDVKVHELYQNISGLHPLVRQATWRTWLKFIAKWFAFGYLLLALYNAFHFLRASYPAPLL